MIQLSHRFSSNRMKALPLPTRVFLQQSTTNIPFRKPLHLEITRASSSRESCHSYCPRNPLLRRESPSSCNYPLILHRREMRFKAGSSFLSDEEGVNNFVDLLGNEEKMLLFNVLSKRLETTDPSSLGSQAESTANSRPTNDQLKLLMIHQMLPFIGFGFLDNLIMILAGEYIDTTIGVTFGISTMAAAALGNTLSDVAGVGSAWYVEKLAASSGVKYPNLSKAQIDMRLTKSVTSFGRVLGIILGCLIGMFPLIFKHNKTKDEENKTDETKEDKPKESKSG